MKKTSKFIFRFLEAVSLRLWWLDVLYPIILALGLVGMFTYVMYSGLKHMRLSSIGENSLIRTSLLMLNTSRIVAAQSTIVISVEESDLAQVPIADQKEAKLAFFQVRRRSKSVGIAWQAARPQRPKCPVRHVFSVRQEGPDQRFDRAPAAALGKVIGRSSTAY